MRWIYVSLIILLLSSPVEARRISRPDAHNIPWTEEQITDLNNTLEDIFNMQKGRYEMDVVTTPKSTPNDGEMWIYTGPTTRLQFRANNTTYDVVSQDTGFYPVEVGIPVALSMFIEKPSRASVNDWNGGLLKLDDAASLSSGSPLAMTTKGTGKIILVVNDGGGDDMVGDITATGTAIDRNTGVATGSATSVMTLTGVTTDNSANDANGNIVYDMEKAYITDKWFYGVVTLTTTDVTLTDLDTYHVSFEQWNDQTDITLNSFDANLFTTNVLAEFDSYLQTLHVTGDECKIDNEAELHVGSIGGEDALANKYFRVRQGNIDEELDGTTDGFWVSTYYANNPVYVEDVTLKVWATKKQTLILD